MKWINKLFSGVLLTSMMAALMVLQLTFAATAISSVNIRVGLNDVGAGETLPDIEIRDGQSSGGSAYVSTNSQHYYVDRAEWVTSTQKELKLGDTPRMKVWLSAANADQRKFSGSYRSSNVKINGGTFKTSAISDGQLVVTIDLNPIKGQYDAPAEAYWTGSKGGTARWSMDDGSSTSNKYEVVLIRGSGTVHKAQTTSTSYNFYPYMTKKGNYYFRVRVIPRTDSQGQYAKTSEWTVSDEMYLAAEDVSDGSGQNENGSSQEPPSNVNNNQQVGWIQNGNRWWFRYPDGSFPKNSWLEWNGKWYLFESSGWMCTGWVDHNSQTYYFDQSGAMRTGWFTYGNVTYYLNPTKDQYEGALVRDRWMVIDGGQYYLNSDGARLEGWHQIDGKYYYFYPGTGIKAVNTTINGFYVDASGAWVSP